MKRKLINILKFAIVGYVIYYFIFSNYYNTYSSSTLIMPDNTFKKSKTFLDGVKETKYITCSVYEAGGLGNQIWRFASLYGLARFTGRIPYFEINQFQTTFTITSLKLINISEIAYLFPIMHEVMQIKDSPIFQTRQINFAEDCCKYEDPLVLLKIQEKYLKIKGNYLQAYKYFHSYRNEIQQIFECGPSVLSEVKNFATNLFKNDKSLKLCAHIRRGDFLNDPLMESKKEFIVPAIEYANNFFTNLGHTNISLVFIGNDQPFAKGLILQNYTNLHQIYTSDSKTRGEDMCFGINYCDAMILTASGSTFAWWMAYLMKSNGPVFRNSQISKTGKEQKDIHDFHLFLPEWISLSLKNDQIIEENQWWHEKIGLNLSAPKMFKRKNYWL